ncbi:MAG: dienelactone hydrolase family protein [Chloroflexi bacterium]|nr:dienelactone hydrolase family protein [Chloroflexota bacterium]MDA1145676.1 dienelactone hydrolase family protein [Chloroflexota bacterium]
MTYRSIMAEEITYRGHEAEQIQAYLARPLGDGPFGSVIVIHHMPGWDAGIMEITRKFAHFGYNAIAPNLYTRFGTGDADEVAAVARAAGGTPDATFVGDMAGAADYLRMMPAANGKVGVIGFCSGGRHAVLAASHLPDLDAAVDCWGGRVIAAPDQLDERHPVAPFDLTPQLNVPLLGIFGNDDRSPTPEQVDQHEAELKKHGKTYEFHRYDGAGHGFFSVNRPAYRPEQATEAWGEVFTWFGRYLSA